MVTGFHLTGNLYRAEGWLFIAKLDWKSQENTLVELTPPALIIYSFCHPPPKIAALFLSLFWHVVFAPVGTGCVCGVDVRRTQRRGKAEMMFAAQV